MPKFLYSILVGTFLMWGVVLMRFSEVPPDTSAPLSILVSMSFLYVALVLTMSLPIYYYSFKKAPYFSDLKGLYRRSFKWAVLLSAMVIGFELIKGFNFLNVLTGGIYFVLCLYIIMQVKHKTKKLR